MEYQSGAGSTNQIIAEATWGAVTKREAAIPCDALSAALYGTVGAVLSNMVLLFSNRGQSPLLGSANWRELASWRKRVCTVAVQFTILIRAAPALARYFFLLAATSCSEPSDGHGRTRRGA